MQLGRAGKVDGRRLVRRRVATRLPTLQRQTDLAVKHHDPKLDDPHSQNTYGSSR
jgi:hypothetical protein